MALSGAVVSVLVLILLQISPPPPAFAGHLNAYVKNQAETTEQDQPVPVPEIKVPGVGGVNVTHSYLSRNVERFSQRIDVFFGEERIYEEETGTYVRVRGSAIYSRGGEFDYDGKFRIKIDLPQLKEKVNLIIESDDESDSTEDFDRITSGSNLVDELEDSEASAALQFILKEKRKWRLSLRPGLKLTNPIETFIRLRFKRAQSIGDYWLSRSTVQAGFYDDRGWENELKLELGRYIGSRNYFRSTSSFLWREDFPGNWFPRQTFLVTHVIDPRQSIAFEVGTQAETRPRVRDLFYFSSISYRRDIHRGWMFFEVKPQVSFARENHYKAEPFLVLSLETLFGAKYLDELNDHHD